MVCMENLIPRPSLRRYQGFTDSVFFGNNGLRFLGHMNIELLCEKLYWKEVLAELGSSVKLEKRLAVEFQGRHKASVDTLKEHLMSTNRA